MPEHSPQHTAEHARRRGARGVAAAVSAAVVLLVVGIVALVLGLQGAFGPSPSAAGQGLPGQTSPTSTPAATTTAPPALPAPTGRPSTPAPGADPHHGATSGSIGQFLPASEPTSIDIPSIGVHSTHFVPLSTQPNGTISVPATAQEVGLYDAGPTPGQLGPAVLAAHVDTPAGVPGIFAELKHVKPGDQVRIGRQDGSRLTFTVDWVAAYRKTQFPTSLVYDGDFTQAEIRLVTCGGPTDNRNEYRDNVIVFGHLSAAH